MHRDKTDDGLENFKCNECSKKFKTKNELRDHSFIHFKGKIYFCDYKGCNKYFKRGKLVTVHKRCHFEPSYKCLGKDLNILHSKDIYLIYFKT